MSDTPSTPVVRETTKTNGNDAASPQGGAAVRSEPEPVVHTAVEEVAPEPQPKTVDFRGLTLELPDSLPGTVAFDYGEIEDARKAVAPVINLIKSIVGMEQYNAIYDKVGAEGLTMDETLAGLEKLMEDLFAAYGTSAGESSASAES